MTRPTKPLSSIPIPVEYSTQKMLHHEYALFGFPLGCPLDLFKDAFVSTSHIPAKDLGHYVGKEV